MLVTDLSHSKIIGKGSDPKVLSFWLEMCLENLPDQWFEYKDEIEDLPQSVWVFGQKYFGGSDRLPKRMSPDEIAEELRKFAQSGAHYPPRTAAEQLTVKGWTIHKVTDKYGEVIVAAYATWVSP
jgi:hypothetical protein